MAAVPEELSKLSIVKVFPVSVNPFTGPDDQRPMNSFSNCEFFTVTFDIKLPGETIPTEVLAS